MEMKLDILMLLPLRYEPNMKVASQIGICSYLTNFGHRVTWVVSSEKERQVQQFFFRGAEVFAIPYRHYFPGSSILTKIINKIPNILRRAQAILKIFKEGKYSILFARDDIFDGLAAVYIKRKYKVTFVFEIVNPLEQEWESSKIELEKPEFLHYVVDKFTALIRVYIMKKADLVLPTTRWFEDGLVKKGISKLKLMSYPNGVDIESFLAGDGKGIREKYHLGNSRVIIYIGVMGKARYLDVLIKAFSKVNEKKEDTRLLMVGKGRDKENLKKLTAELGIKDEVIFTGQVHQSEVPNFIAAADIGISPVPPLPFYKVSSPIKMFEYMAMTKPVVANEEIPEHKEVLEQSGGGILVPFTPEAFAGAIIEILDNPEQAAEMGRRGREWVINNRSYEILARRLEKRFLALLVTT